MAERIKENEYWKKYYESLTPDNLLWKNVLASLLEKHDERITELKTEAESDEDETFYNISQSDPFYNNNDKLE